MLRKAVQQQNRFTAPCLSHVHAQAWKLRRPRPDAAIDLLGTEGLRALTHVRVDERARLPRGSTSNYFRTRAALLNGVVERIVEREMPGVGAAFSPSSVDDFVDALCRWFAYATGLNRVLTTARLVLS